MDFNLYITEYLKDGNRHTDESGCILSGCRELYQASQSEEERAFLLNFLREGSKAPEGAKEQELKVLLPGNTYFFLYDNTGETHYKETIDVCMKWLKCCSRTENGVFGCGKDSSCQMPWNILYQVYPFYMKYETRYHNKAEYLDIVKQLFALRTSEDAWTSETGWYLMTVIDVMDSMSQEIFEHYKSLEEIFKKTIRNILERGWDKNFDKKESAMMGYSIVKACNLGVLNSEKYAEVGLSMIDGMINDPFDPKDSEMVGIAMMAYAERLTLNLN